MLIPLLESVLDAFLNINVFSGVDNLFSCGRERCEVKWAFGMLIIDDEAVNISVLQPADAFWCRLLATVFIPIIISILRGCVGRFGCVKLSGNIDSC